MSTTRTAARRTAQEHAARLRAEQARKDAARRHRLTALAVVVVLALVAGAGVLVQSLRSGASASADAEPAWAVDGTGIPVGDEAAPVTVEVYEDYMCPACGQFETVAGPVLDELVDAGTVRVVYRPMAFMDRYTSNRWSTRALNAAVCAVDEGTPFGDVHSALFAAQPEKGTAGPDDDALLALAADAGADGEAFEQCVRDETYAGWTVTATDAASKAGVNGTPTVVVDGERLTSWDPQALRAAVRAASSS
ncbi:DsbA family protein [Thalassiella azotivora]